MPNNRLKFQTDKDEAKLLRNGDIIDVTTFRQLMGTAKTIEVPKPATVKKKVYSGKQKEEVVCDQRIIGSAFFIPGQVPSWKNHHQILKRRMTPSEKENALIKRRGTRGNPKWFNPVRYYIGKSKVAQAYEQKAMPLFQERAEEFRQLTAGMSPVIIEVTFVNNTLRQKWDFNNYVQGIADMMVRSGWIVDDSIDELITIPPLAGPRWVHSPKNPGVLIKVLQIDIKRKP